MEGGAFFSGNAMVRGRDWYTLLHAPVLTLDVTFPGGHLGGHGDAPPFRQAVSFRTGVPRS